MTGDVFSATPSFAQQRLWFLDQVETHSGAYVISVALRIGGALDVGALEKALGALVARHESLRTRFSSSEGRPAQVIVEALPVSLPVLAVEDEIRAGGGGERGG